MTNIVALFLGLVIAIAVAVDLGFNDSAATVFTARKFLALLEWVVFWR